MIMHDACSSSEAAAENRHLRLWLTVQQLCCFYYVMHVQTVVFAVEMSLHQPYSNCHLTNC